MTTLTAKSRPSSIRTWGRNEHIFADETNGWLPTLFFDPLELCNTFDKEHLFVSTGLSPARKNWLIPTAQKISSLPFHTDNWSAGAKRTEPGVIKQLLNILSQILPDEAPAPAIVPTWLGGVQAEWHRNSVDLEISVNPGEAVEYYFNNGDDEYEGLARDDWAKLQEYARAVA